MKKVTLFVDKTLREGLKKSTEWSVAYRAALDFFSKLVAYGSDPRFTTPIANREELVQQLRGCQDGFNKFICGCHSESNTVKKVFSEAHRIEACLTLRWYKSITLEFSAYHTGEKAPFHQLSFTFSKEDGSPACASY